MLVSSVEANAALETEGITGDALANEVTTDAQMSERDTITLADVDALRSIGRKSINKFTSEDIKKAEPFARIMWQTLGTKSPFFRAWFGDWRANDTASKVKVITVSNIESFNAVTDTLRGDFSNFDTGWNNITVGRKGIDDTISHSGKEKVSEKTLSEIKNIIQNSILLDTQVSMPDSGKKSKYTVFMHKMYSPVIVNGRNYIAKVAVEEYVENTDTKKKFYNLQNIKISPEAVNFESDIKSDSNVQVAFSDDSISISDLFQLVKTYDKEFNPKEPSKVVNADGTPKVVYHGTNKNFNTFESRDGVYWFSESFDYAESMAEERDGNTVMQVYLNLKNPLYVKLPEGKFSDPTYKKPVIAKAKAEGYDGVVFETDTDNELVYDKFYVAFEKGQIKSATDNIGTFDRGNEDIQFSERDNARITAEMSDEERTRILSGKSIAAPIYNGQADNAILSEKDNLLNKEDTIFKAAIKRIGEQFDVFTDDQKPIPIEDMDFGVFFSRGGADESSKKKVTDIRQLAKILPILRDAVENSIGIECHDNRYFADHNTKEFYELLGGYIEGNDFIPVRFGVKSFKDGTYSFVVVCQDKIKKTNVTKPSSSDLNGSQNGSRLVSDISISQISKFVKGKDLLRYLPDGMLNENQRQIKYEGIAETIKYTNDKNDKKYREFIKKQDIDSAKRMVTQAARLNGYTVKAYHGGDHFFTVFGKGNKTSSAPEGAYFFTDNMDVAYSYTAYKNIVDLNVNNHPIYKQATPEGRIEENRVSHGGVYPVYLKFQNPYIVDFEGRHWGNKVNGMDINEIAVWAKENGYDGVIAKNIIDAGDMGDVNYEEGNTRVPSTDYIIFDSARAKSSETITYDDEGNIIPISERFNQENDDIRYSERDYGTSAYDLVGEHKTLEKRYKKLEADFENFKERVSGKRGVIRVVFLSAKNLIKDNYGNSRKNTYNAEL